MYRSTSHFRRTARFVGLLLCVFCGCRKTSNPQDALVRVVAPEDAGSAAGSTDAGFEPAVPTKSNRPAAVHELKVSKNGDLEIPADRISIDVESPALQVGKMPCEAVATCTPECRWEQPPVSQRKVVALFDVDGDGRLDRLRHFHRWHDRRERGLNYCRSLGSGVCLPERHRPENPTLVSPWGGLSSMALHAAGVGLELAEGEVRRDVASEDRGENPDFALEEQPHVLQVDGEGGLDVVFPGRGRHVDVYIASPRGLEYRTKIPIRKDEVLQSVVAGQFDGKGARDLAIGLSHEETSRVVILRGKRTARGKSKAPRLTYTEVRVVSVEEADVIVAVDVDGDGRDEVIAGRELIEVDSGKTVELPTAAAYAAGDFDGDGNIDLLAATDVPWVGVYRGDGEGAFEPPAAFYDMRGTKLTVDINGDGNLDVLSGYEAYFGKGDGTFWAPDYDREDVAKLRELRRTDPRASFPPRLRERCSPAL